jgi:hypothetical protein
MNVIGMHDCPIISPANRVYKLIVLGKVMGKSRAGTLLAR